VKRIFRHSLLFVVGAVLSGFASAGALAVSAPGGIDVATRVSADSVTVGERLRVVHSVTYPDSFTLLPPGAFDTGTCRLISVAWKEEKKEHRVTKTANLDVMTTDLEHARLPKTAFGFRAPAGDTVVVYTDEVDVPVRYLTGEKSEPKPLKPQWEAPRSYTFLYVIAGGIALAALAFWLYRRWRRRAAVKAPEPELPADFVALQRLDEIERMHLVEKGEIKTHYTLVVDTLRRYMEKRYDILAMDQTSDEILWSLRRASAEIGDIEPVLREADLVKFAKYRPEAGAAKGLIDVVRGIVARTAPRPLDVAAGAD
jgi:hypothetical protein